jgi:hypothetical protein
MSIIIPILSEYVGKGTQAAIADLKKLGKAQLASAVSAGAVVDVARRSIQAANEDAKSQRLLANTLKNTTFAREADVAMVEKNLQALQYSAAVADDELRPALANLLRVTKDSAQAQDLLGTALDISAATGRDLQTVTLSLGRAYQGNVGALRRLGLAVSDGAVANKDFQQALDEIIPVVEGSAKAAAAGADGGWKKLGIAVGDLSEILGTELNNQLGGVVGALGKATAAANESGDSQTFLGAAVKATISSLVSAIVPFANFNRGMRDSKDNAKDAAKEIGTLGDRIKQLDQQDIRTFQSNQKAAAQAAYAARMKAAKEAAEKLAKANKERLATALQTAKEKLDDLIKSSDDYRDSLRDQLYGTVSLADAVSRATDSEATFNDALQERKEAYEELAKLQAVVFDAATGKTTVANAEDLADALERVRKAEEGVTAAQGQRVNYTAAFREQIAAAKEFATSLQSLIGQGLTSVGLQQLINLGPVAGAQVAKDILSGSAGLSVSDLNLTGLQAAATGVGAAAASQQFGADITAAQNTLGAVTYANDIKITVTSADPDKVVEALLKWSKKNGKLPAGIRVS